MNGGPILVTALFGDGDNGWLQELRRIHYPPALNRVPAHLTLFRHLPPGVEAELSGRLAAATAAPPPRAAIAGVMDLGTGTALRVESEGLEEIREDLARAFHGLLTPQDQAAWHPHVTIQNKVAPREARALQARLRAAFEPRLLAIRGLASWRYAGGPWEALKSHSFRRWGVRPSGLALRLRVPHLRPCPRRSPLPKTGRWASDCGWARPPASPSWRP